MNDLRFAFRKLRQSPAFTLIAVVTLALGIGLNTAIFSLLNDLLLKGLPFMGRTFLPQEEEGADVAIITDRFWRARFAGSQDIIGKTIVLDGVAHTIVGVIANMPVSWTGTPNANIWTTKPMVIPGFSHERMMRGSAFLRVIGRLKAGVTLDQAKAVLGTLEDSYSSQFPEKSDAQNRNI